MDSGVLVSKSWFLQWLWDISEKIDVSCIPKNNTGKKWFSVAIAMYVIKLWEETFINHVLSEYQEGKFVETKKFNVKTVRHKKGLKIR